MLKSFWEGRNCPTWLSVVHGTKAAVPAWWTRQPRLERERDETAACLRDARLGRQSFHCQQSRAVAARGNARACGKCGREEGTGSRSRKQKSLALTASVSPPWREARRGETTHLSFAASRCVA